MDYTIIIEQKNNLKLYEKTLQLLNRRIENFIDNKLGLVGTSFEEAKIIVKNNQDTYLKAFEQLEELENERDFLINEINLIKDYFQQIDKEISRMAEKEKQVFKSKYLYGLGNNDIAEKLDCSEKTIRRYIKKIEENSKMSGQCP